MIYNSKKSGSPTAHLPRQKAEAISSSAGRGPDRALTLAARSPWSPWPLRRAFGNESGAPTGARWGMRRSSPFQDTSPTSSPSPETAKSTRVWRDLK